MGFCEKEIIENFNYSSCSCFCLHGVKKVANKFGIHLLEKSNIEINYEHEWDNISKKDKKIIKKAISLAKKKKN